MRANGATVQHERISSPNGHDTFLIDYDLDHAAACRAADEIPGALESVRAHTEVLSGRMRQVGAVGDRRAVAALGVVAELDVALALRSPSPSGTARRTSGRAGDGAVVEGEVALRVARAGEEDAAAGAALDQLALAAVRALHAGRLRRRRLAAADLADGLAVGIAGAASRTGRSGRS